MKSFNKLQKIFFAIVTLIVFTFPFWFSQPPDQFEFTFDRPVGGEDRRVQTVKLYCAEGASKGATEGNVWCQEVVLSERVEE